MRIAVFADLHANYMAYYAFKKDVKSEGVDAYWFLGDMVGYGPDPVRVVREMYDLYMQEDNGDGWVPGNHDMVVAEKLEVGRSIGVAGMWLNEEGWSRAMLATCHIHRELLRRKRLIGQLDKMVSTEDVKEPLEGVVIAHGSPLGRTVKRRVSTYLHGEALIWKTVAEMKKQRDANGEAPLRLVIVGHRHWRLLYEIGEDNELTEYRPDSSLHIFEGLGQRRIVFINPGSAGFPREPERRPSYVILELDDNYDRVKVQFRQIKYNCRLVFDRLSDSVRPMAENWGCE